MFLSAPFSPAAFFPPTHPRRRGKGAERSLRGLSIPTPHPVAITRRHFGRSAGYLSPPRAPSLIPTELEALNKCSCSAASSSTGISDAIGGFARPVRVVGAACRRRYKWTRGVCGSCSCATAAPSAARGPARAMALCHESACSRFLNEKPFLLKSCNSVRLCPRGRGGGAVSPARRGHFAAPACALLPVPPSPRAPPPDPLPRAPSATRRRGSVDESA